MSWEHIDLTTDDTQSLQEGAEYFIRDHEAFCVSLAARFLRRDPGRDRLYLYRLGRGEVQALLFLSHGILFPLLGGISVPAELLMNIDAANPINGKFSSKAGNIHSLQGLRYDVESLEEVLHGVREREQIDYHLLFLEREPDITVLEAGPPDLRIRPLVNESDLKQLLPLQEAYEREEVLPRTARFNRHHCRLGLARLVREQRVLVAEWKGSIIGKANTNALAYTRGQIGGVYVVPEYRRRGIATCLVANLAKVLRKEGWKAGLFVKQKNQAALGTYEKIGFEFRAPYRITYL